MNPIKIIVYSTTAGREPYSIWEDDLDAQAHAIVKNRLDRIKLGNFGDAKMLRGCAGLWELRIDYGPGYRIYFGKKCSTIVVLLAGGDKKSQSRDIQKAKRFWTDYEKTS